MSPDRRRLTHLIGVVTTREWRTMKQLAASGVFPSPEAARKFCTRHRESLVLGRKGRELLVDERSLNRFLEAQALQSA